MLPKSYRLPKDVFSVIGKNGTRFVTPNFQFIIQKNANPQSRLGIVVGKRIAKRAVLRNRMKRVIREAFWSIQSTCTFPLDVLCIVKQDCSMKKSADLKKEMSVLNKTKPAS